MVSKAHNKMKIVFCRWKNVPIGWCVDICRERNGGQFCFDADGKYEYPKVPIHTFNLS